MPFLDAYDFVRVEEGGYVNDPSDSGGATNGGVTQATYNLYRLSKQFDTRPVQYITNIEKTNIFAGIWNDCQAGLLPNGLSLCHFDAAVNVGNAQAAKFLQRALGVKDDGVIGPVTLAAVKACDVPQTIVSYCEFRRTFYRSLASARPKDMKFLKGWLLRTNRCERRALSTLASGTN